MVLFVKNHLLELILMDLMTLRAALMGLSAFRTVRNTDIDRKSVV